MARSEPAFWIIFKLCKVSSCSKYIWIFWINTFWLINQDKPQGPQLEYLKTHCNCPKLLLLERISKANRQNYKTSRGRKQHNKYEKLLFQVAFKIKWLNFTNIDFFFFPRSDLILLTLAELLFTWHWQLGKPKSPPTSQRRAGGRNTRPGGTVQMRVLMRGSTGASREPRRWIVVSFWGLGSLPAINQGLFSKNLLRLCMQFQEPWTSFSVSWAKDH